METYVASILRPREHGARTVVITQVLVKAADPQSALLAIAKEQGVYGFNYRISTPRPFLDTPGEVAQIAFHTFDRAHEQEFRGRKVSEILARAALAITQ